MSFDLPQRKKDYYNVASISSSHCARQNSTEKENCTKNTQYFIVISYYFD